MNRQLMAELKAIRDQSLAATADQKAEFWNPVPPEGDGRLRAYFAESHVPDLQKLSSAFNLEPLPVTLGLIQHVEPFAEAARPGRFLVPLPGRYHPSVRRTLSEMFVAAMGDEWVTLIVFMFRSGGAPKWGKEPQDKCWRVWLIRNSDGRNFPMPRKPDGKPRGWHVAFYKLVDDIADMIHRARA